jgi:Tol biopolymer transport system component
LVGESLKGETMTSLPEGTQLGPYRVLGPIGAGGMGEVYKAEDPRLDRVVAIKLLPPHFAGNPEMRQRFEREARIVASLKHANICVLHDIGHEDGKAFLVMEYLEGETLAACLRRGAMPCQAALKAAIGIAGALDVAHRSEIVHRDLKPGNVILTPDGPKLLDFGLAKWDAPAASAATQVVTHTDITSPGAVLGTLQYMAPEQLEGLEADARTDIFAFGALLHEMLTGQKAFTGKTRILLMSAIASADTEPVSRAQPAAPPGLDHIVRTCLAKDPADRWQTARDLLAELEWVAGGGAQTQTGFAGTLAGQAPVPGKSWRRLQAMLALAGLLVVAVAVPAVAYFVGPPPPEEFSFQVPFNTNAEPNALNPNVIGRGPTVRSRNFAISADGVNLVYPSQIAVLSSSFPLFVRPIGSVIPRQLTGTDGAERPFWSPDGRFIGYVAGGKLKKVESSGGPPQDICAVEDFAGGAWNREGVIVFATARGLFRVPAEGGKPEPVRTGKGESAHAEPTFLPDGRTLLYSASIGGASQRAVFAGSLDSREPVRLLGADAAYFAQPPRSNTGYLVFHRENAVYAQPFQPKSLALTGEPQRVADSVAESRTFAVSPNGVLVYYPEAGRSGFSGGFDDIDLQLSWVDRFGKLIADIGPPGLFRGFEVSPDGKRVAVHQHHSSGGDVLVIEPDQSVKKLTMDATRHNSSPVWSPDGRHIVYSAVQKGKWGLYQTRSDGSGTEELLYESEEVKAPSSWSPDGKRIVFWIKDPKTGGALWVLTTDDKKAAPLIGSASYETHGQISPDGKWIAYTSTLTGRHEIHVRPFPSGSGHYQVSFHGGAWPRWKGDGKELFFHAIASTPDVPAAVGPFLGPLLSAPVNVRGSAFEAGIARDILRMPVNNHPHTGGDYHSWAVSSDGQRILRVAWAPPTAAAGSTVATTPVVPAHLTVRLHWASALKK